MVRNKASAKKHQKPGIDFKKIKRKLGRILPPPKNATNTQIKSKAIVLPEQSVATEKTGLAVSKKGLTLKELLQQTFHHNAKVRKDALLGVRDLFQNYPADLRLHRYSVIENLYKRISDDDKSVRETLYQLLKSVIFPGCKEDNQGHFFSSMMAYIFDAMSHRAIDVRLMAFKFFDLLVQYYPPSFSLHAEKILQNYENILWKDQFYIQEKGKLKVALAALVRYLLLLPCNTREVDSFKKNIVGQEVLHGFETDMPKEGAGFSHISSKLKDLVAVLVNCFQDLIPLVHTTPVLDAQSFDCMYSILQSICLALRFSVYGNHKGRLDMKHPYEGPDMSMWGQTLSSLLKKLLGMFPLNSTHHLSEKDDDRYFILNIVMTEILLQFGEWICPPTHILEKFLEFIEIALLGKICSSTRSGKAVWEKNLLSLLPYIPKLVLQVDNDWKYRLLQAFTTAFNDCNPDSSLKLACISTIEEMLIPREDMLYLDPSDPEILDYQITWIRGLPQLLILLGDLHPSSSQAVLNLLLRLGQRGFLNASCAIEYEMQYALRDFYSSCQEEGDVCYGPFIRLPRDSQELSISCLYYFSDLDSLLLKSIASCCLYSELEPCVLFQIVEILNSAYKAGHIQIADHISFFITLLSRFNVFPEKMYPTAGSDAKKSNRGTYKVLTGVVCSFLSEMGDSSLVFQILQTVIVDQIMLKLPLDNACALLRMLVSLDSKPTRLSEEHVVCLSNFLLGYLIDVVHSIPEDDAEKSVSSQINTRRYFLLPCFFLFDRSHKLLNLVLHMLVSVVTESSSSLLSCNRTQYAADCLNRINASVSLILLMHKDVKIQKVISLFKAEVDQVLQSMLSLQSSETTKITIEERHKIQCASDLLKIVISTLPDGVPIM